MVTALSGVIASAVLGGIQFGDAVLLSFGSDTDPDNPTMVAQFQQGPNNTLISAFDPTVVQLLVDPDEDGPAGPFAQDVLLTMELTLTYVSSTNIIPNVFAHLFSVQGFFQFSDIGAEAGDDPLPFIRGDVSLGEAVFTGIGNSQVVSAASITGFDIDYTLFGGFGLGEMVLPGDFGFTLTDMNDGSGAPLIYGPELGGGIIGIGDFTAESSYSGRIVIPSTGVLAGFGVFGLSSIRRRRSA